MAAQPLNQKPHDQAQLLEKFRKLRQWQQQQQESMFHQQQQQMETLKMEQNKLQSILAAQKRLHEQQTTSSATVRSSTTSATSPNQADTLSSTTAQSHSQQTARAPMPINMKTRAEPQTSEPIGHNSNVLLRSIPMSSAPPIVMNQADLDFQMRQFGYQQYNGTTEKLEGSLASFNKTVYPMMWNSSNYRLPLGTIPLSSAPKAVPLQGQAASGLANSDRLIPYAGMDNGMVEVPSSFQNQVSSQELRGVGYNPGRDRQSHFEVNAREANTALQCAKSPVMTPELERLWSHHPGVKSLADAESQIDEQSEADAMSGIYPLHDSEPEMGVNDSNIENDEEEMNEESEAEEELEETSERNATVIELEPCPEDVQMEGTVSVPDFDILNIHVYGRTVFEGCNCNTNLVFSSI